MPLGAASSRTEIYEAQIPGVCDKTQGSEVSLLMRRALSLADCVRLHHPQVKPEQTMHTWILRFLTCRPAPL